MRLSDKCLTDEFEINALWSVDGYDIKGVVGTLFYSKNRIILDLLDIDDLELSEKGSNAFGKINTETISLFNLRVVGKHSLSISNTKIMAECMIIDFKVINDLKDFKLDSAIFSFDYLPLLFNKTFWRKDRRTDSFIKDEIESKTYEINSLNPTLVEMYRWEGKSEVTPESGLVTNLTTHPYLKIEYSEDQSILKIKKKF